MPTIITHALVPLACAAAVGRGRIAPSVALAGAVLAMVPDADVIGFAMGIDYADNWGHRGASHSLAIAALMTGIVAALWPQTRSGLSLPFLFAAMASHGLLDMATSGGLGVALAWPWDDARMFFPATPIRVSPIGADFFSLRGLETLWSEACWVWLPCTLLVAACWAVRRRLG